ncbi:MAG: patatin-like phospholipase family protein [Treponema sp.]|nr:patatin-like phospholipase family protein [Treponema sp.]
MKRLLVFLCVIFSCCTINLFAQNYALVLSGGGGKGGYEVGVWKALNEYGIAQKVSVISGTSVGGLNAGLFAVAPMDRIEDIWLNQVPSELNQDGEAISQKGLMNIMNRLSFYAFNEKNVPDVYVTCCHSWKDGVGGLLDVGVQIAKAATKSVFDYAYRFRLNDEESQDEIRKKMLATSAYPALTDPVRLSDGKLYCDGGAADNTPVEPVIKYQPDIIIAVHLSAWSPKLQKGKWPGYTVIDIVPSDEMRWIGGMLDFSREWTVRNIQLGYDDTVKWLKGLGMHPVEDYWFQ